jgi:hypothetical protein
LNEVISLGEKYTFLIKEGSSLVLVWGVDLRSLEKYGFESSDVGS